jgi:hypothetical protein
MNKTKLIPFDFERWKKGDCKVVTKSGKEVSDLTYFKSATQATYPLVGVLENYIEFWTIDGAFLNIQRNSQCILMLEVEDKTLEGWVNVFDGALGSSVYPSKELAMKHYSGYSNYITTIQITYNDNNR